MREHRINQNLRLAGIVNDQIDATLLFDYMSKPYNEIKTSITLRNANAQERIHHTQLQKIALRRFQIMSHLLSNDNRELSANDLLILFYEEDNLNPLISKNAKTLSLLDITEAIALFKALVILEPRNSHLQKILSTLEQIKQSVSAYRYALLSFYLVINTEHTPKTIDDLLNSQFGERLRNRITSYTEQGDIQEIALERALRDFNLLEANAYIPTSADKLHDAVSSAIAGIIESPHKSNIFQLQKTLEIIMQINPESQSTLTKNQQQLTTIVERYNTLYNALIEYWPSLTENEIPKTLRGLKETITLSLEHVSKNLMTTSLDTINQSIILHEKFRERASKPCSPASTEKTSSPARKALKRLNTPKFAPQNTMRDGFHHTKNKYLTLYNALNEYDSSINLIKIPDTLCQLIDYINERIAYDVKNAQHQPIKTLDGLSNLIRVFQEETGVMTHNTAYEKIKKNHDKFEELSNALETYNTLVKKMMGAFQKLKSPETLAELKTLILDRLTSAFDTSIDELNINIISCELRLLKLLKPNKLTDSFIEKKNTRDFQLKQYRTLVRLLTPFFKSESILTNLVIAELNTIANKVFSTVFDDTYDKKISQIAKNIIFLSDPACAEMLILSGVSSASEADENCKYALEQTLKAQKQYENCSNGLLKYNTAITYTALPETLKALEDLIEQTLNDILTKENSINKFDLDKACTLLKIVDPELDSFALSAVKHFILSNQNVYTKLFQFNEEHASGQAKVSKEIMYRWPLEQVQKTYADISYQREENGKSVNVISIAVNKSFRRASIATHTPDANLSTASSRRASTASTAAPQKKPRRKTYVHLKVAPQDSPASTQSNLSRSTSQRSISFTGEVLDKEEKTDQTTRNSSNENLDNSDNLVSFFSFRAPHEFVITSPSDMASPSTPASNKSS